MTTFSEEEFYYKLDNMVLSCCPHLREVFKIRWKEQTKSDWFDNKSNTEKLLKSLTPHNSKSKKCPLKGFQQIALQEKILAEWDISLLSDILLLQQPVCEKMKQENEAIRKLKDIRNVLAHNDIGNDVRTEDGYITRKCTQTEYEKHSEELRNSLINLGMEGKEINKLIDLSGVTSSLKAVERAKALYAEAEAFIQEQQYDTAIDLYSDALHTPSLLPEHRGEAYEKRAECYLKCMTAKGNDFIDLAQIDVEKALELNKSSWFANYLAAQCYRKRYDLGQAIHYFELALAGTPIPKQVDRDLKCCEILAGKYRPDKFMSPLRILINLEEQLNQLEKSTGIKMMEGDEKSFFTEIGKVFPGQDHVLHGHDHFIGWKSAQNFEEALHHYSRADMIGNAEGSFNLGKCYHFGCGVEQDVMKAFKIYQDIAQMDKHSFGLSTTLKCNVGVAYSQYSIGTMYAKGEAVGQNFREAAAWFKKAMDNGVEFAANALGNLYANGKGVPLDEIMAESCWVKAFDLKDSNAAASLVAYYIRENKPERAIVLMQTGRRLGNEYLNSISNDEFCAAIKSSDKII